MWIYDTSGNLVNLDVAWYLAVHEVVRTGRFNMREGVKLHFQVRATLAHDAHAVLADCESEEEAKAVIDALRLELNGGEDDFGEILNG